MQKTSARIDDIKTKKGFTLTEVLLAITVVAIISLLVLPKIITMYHTKVQNNSFARQQISLTDSLNALVVNEQKRFFYETSMGQNDSATFMKKYLRTAKICNPGEECFAKEYTSISGGNKTTYNPDYSGTCATLKNGMSMCLRTTINPNGEYIVNALVDLNGKKLPNILGQDLRGFTINMGNDRLNIDKTTSAVIK